MRIDIPQMVKHVALSSSNMNNVRRDNVFSTKFLAGKNMCQSATNMVEIMVPLYNKVVDWRLVVWRVSDIKVSGILGVGHFGANTIRRMRCRCRVDGLGGNANG